ncbi:MAG: 30S ribosomal protein S8 [Candidatus Binatia bacterium]|nr:MAG: 30S ribosomal protein S8 [Candidatus Binatia bacterium]
MGMTDPIADLLTRIRNATRARKEEVDAPWSRLKEEIVRIMTEEGFLAGYEVVPAGSYRNLRIRLKYDAQRRPVITDLKRVSKPSLRVYRGAKEIPKVRGGLGISIVSTPAGVLVDREARRRNVGGEILCAVW